MDSQQHAQVKKIFLSAIDLNAEQLKDYLATQTSDQTIINQVQELLKTYQNNTQYTQDYVQEIADNISKSPLLFPSERYLLIKKIGQGGMGDVYLAQRKLKDIQQKVAIKILQFTDKISKNRFSQETHILSQLSHPNISQFIDADFLTDGRPYVVMEYTQGQTITDYCRENKLTIKQRLSLFKDLCQAVQHAHRNLIIHRDIKPDNILVNGVGELKLLDFGIAKIIQESSTGKTQTQMHALTPAYASPEQFMGKAVSVSTDVYSLGVLLYELLTGSRPHEPKDHSPIEFEQLLKTTSPTKPSLKVSESPGFDNLSRWKNTLTGDLDKIILKALQFDVAQRYQTVEEITDDLNRYKTNLPVLAHKPGIYYHLDKFIKRNNLLVISVSALALFTFYTFQQKILLKDTSDELKLKNKEISNERDKANRAQTKAENLTRSLSVSRYADPLNNGKQNLVADNNVNIATGYLYHQEKINLSDGLFNFTVYYNSNYALHTRTSTASYTQDPIGRDSFYRYTLGKGWNHNYTKWVDANWSRVGNRIMAYRGDGQLIKFTNHNNQWKGQPNISETFTIDKSNKYNELYFIKNSEQGIEAYNNSHRLLGIRNDKRTISLKYGFIKGGINNNRIERLDSDIGKYISFGYVDNKLQIEQITNDSGEFWKFKYDLYDNLISILYPDGREIRFIYDQSKHLLTGISYPNHRNKKYLNTRSVIYDYDPFNRVYRISYKSAPCANEELLIVYNNDKTRTVTNSNGKVNHYTVEKIDKVWKISKQSIEFEYKQCLKKMQLPS